MIGVYLSFSIFIVLKSTEITLYEKNDHSCIRFGVSHFFPNCKSESFIKNGRTTNGKQRYCCKVCVKWFIVNDTYNAYRLDTNQQIILFTKEGLGIRGVARVKRK